MLESDWDAGTIYTILDAPRVHDFRSDITVLKIDDRLKVVIGYSQDGSVFFGCPQFGEIKGFKKGRAKLEVAQSIDLNTRGVVEPALALSFFVNSEEELRAISTIFSGLYDLNKNSSGTEKATLAAQGFEGYFSELPRIGLTSEAEIGLFGELSIIAASSKKEDLVRGWHSSPDATYDFSFNGNRLEIKTSTRPTRLVWLRGSQTVRDADPCLTYLSIYAPIDDAGINVRELSEQIKAQLPTSLLTIFDEKLGFYDLANCKKRFDLRSATGSFRFVSSSDIPTISAEDPRILEIQWKCSFDNLPSSGDSVSWM
jgi:hypothetical protein